MSMADDQGNLKKAAFAAGCFWHVEYAFSRLKGVISTQVGYEGGQREEPTYREVCTGRTGHAETVELLYDPSIVSYDILLKAFWGMHDPTTMNRQGPDVGSQYRSAIFYFDEEQMRTAERSKEEEQSSGRHNGAVVTQIVPASRFWPAEEYHQKYFEKTGRHSCGI